jgi:hypothetical protein
MGCIYTRPDSKFLWIKYTGVDGRAYAESTRTTKKEKAKGILRSKEGKIVDGIAITPEVNRLIFPDAVAAVVRDYTRKGQRTVSDLRWRIETYCGVKMDKVGFLEFWGFMFRERMKMLNFLKWVGKMEHYVQPNPKNL